MFSFLTPSREKGFSSVENYQPAELLETLWCYLHFQGTSPCHILPHHLFVAVVNVCSDNGGSKNFGLMIQWTSHSYAIEWSSTSLGRKFNNLMKSFKGIFLNGCFKKNFLILFLLPESVREFRRFSKTL